jgi:hypothetical protein
MSSKIVNVSGYVILITTKADEVAVYHVFSCDMSIVHLLACSDVAI